MDFQLRWKRSIGIVTVAAVVVVAAVSLGTFAGGVAGQESGSTRAPDLQSVDNFRTGTAGGEPATLVDFTFDENATLVSSGGNFRLVPTDGGTDVGGQNIVAGNGTKTITVAFSSDLNPSDIARGVVKKNTVRVTGAGDGTNNPTESADVSNGGTTADPDLVNVTVNETTHSLVYAFDEPVSVESDSGFKAYANNTTTMGGSVATPSLATPRLVDVTFDKFSVSQVVGASVAEGTVSNANHSDRTNSLDEVTVSNESAPAFSKCGGGGTNDTGDGGGANGPTRAPDLVDIDNFTYRQNPEGKNCQTLVDFDFDQPVNTQGGAGNFQLVSIDGNGTFDGNNEIVGPKKNTTSLTVPFDGRVDPTTVARGFVDHKTVQTDGEGDSTLNPKESADLNNDGNTANPDLVSISAGGANQLRFTFDENLSEIGDTSGFNFYDVNGTETDAQNVNLTNNSSVVSVYFEPQANVSTKAVGGSVDANAVVGEDTTRQDGDTNQPDEVALGTTIGPVGNATNPPTDPNGDGKYEDVNGDGTVDSGDTQALYDNLDTAAIQNNPGAFDFNGDGTVDVVDVQKLSTETGGQQ